MSTNNSGSVKTVLIGTNIQPLNNDIQQNEFTGEDLKRIRELSKKDDVFDVLADSIAPGIYGHQDIKRALVLQLLGGNETNLEDGTHLRGDISSINILNCINYADIYTICDPGVLCSNIGRKDPHIFNNINLGRLLSRSGLQEIKDTKIANKESINDALSSVKVKCKPFFVKSMPNGDKSDFYFRNDTVNTRQSLVARWASGASTPNDSRIKK